MKIPPLHPFAFVVFPVLSLYSHNLGLFPWTDVLRPVEWGIAITAVAYVALWAVFALLRPIGKSPILPSQAPRGNERSEAGDNRQPTIESASAAVSILILEFFTFGYAWLGFQKVAPSWLFGNPHDFLYVWIPVALLILLPFGWRRKRTAGMTRFLNAVGLILLAQPLFTIAAGLISIKRDLNQVSTLRAGAPSSGISAVNAPDIIYVILDGYGREDEVKQYMHFDNHQFIQELESRGFYVATKARSNYCQTELSLSSSLNMNFVSNLVGPMPKDSMDRAPLDRLLDKSAVAEFLKKRGYEYIAITSGFPGVNPSSADVLLTDTQGYSLFESSLLAATPIVASSGTLESQYDSRRRKLAAAYGHLTHLGARGAKPRFVFVHILAPHPPFVFGLNGEAVRPSHTTFGYWDASAFFAVGGTLEEYVKGYSGQLQYVNMMTLRAVDQIRRDESVPPVIILQGDHGSRAHLSQEELGKSDVRESFRNLNAYLVPPSVKAKLYPGITPVNSFRVVLNGVFGASFPVLPDRSYFTTWSRPYDPIDVTANVEMPL